MRGLSKRFYDFLRMRSIYRRVRSLSMSIGAVAMFLITAISISVYIHSTMQLLIERESRYLSVYSVSITGELAQIDRELSELSAREEVQTLLRDPIALTEDFFLSRQISLTPVVEQALSQYDAATDVYLFTPYASETNLFRGPHGDVNTACLDTISLFYDTGFFSETGSYLTDAAAFSENAQENAEGMLCLHRIEETGTARTRGYFLVYLDKKLVFGSLADDESGRGKLTRFIADNTGAVLYSTGGNLPENLMQRILTQGNGGEGSFVLDGAVFFGARCVYCRIGGLDLYAVTVIPYSMLSSEIMLVILALLVMLTLLFFVYSVMSKSVAMSVSMPVSEVLQSLRKIQRQDFSASPQDEHCDELTEVNHLLNDTKRLLTEQIAKIKDTERQKYDLRLQILRTQINPHFLVNTLNSIIWLSSLQGMDNIKTLTSSLSALLIPCMRNTSGVAPIGSEIALLHEYATIMEFQYMNQFSLSFDIDHAVEEYLAPVLFLQPLIENSLIHGRDSSTPLLKIVVTARLRGDHIEIFVTDDGKGMSDERLKDISECETTKKPALQTFTSIGVSNIRERMGLLYGKRPYSLTIGSREKQGTTVKITLPLLKKEEIHETDIIG